MVAGETMAQPQRSRGAKLPSGTKQFPAMLHDMLEDADRHGFEHIISWLPNGLCFRVHRPNELVEEVLPKYFGQQTKYKSFQRQLNMYEFKMLRKTPEGSGLERFKGAFFHPLFVRGDQESLDLILRKTTINMHSSRGDEKQHASAATIFSGILAARASQNEYRIRSSHEGPTSTSDAGVCPSEFFIRATKPTNDPFLLHRKGECPGDQTIPFLPPGAAIPSTSTDATHSSFASCTPIQPSASLPCQEQTLENIQVEQGGDLSTFHADNAIANGILPRASGRVPLNFDFYPAHHALNASFWHEHSHRTPVNQAPDQLLSVQSPRMEEAKGVEDFQPGRQTTSERGNKTMAPGCSSGDQANTSKDDLEDAIISIFQNNSRT